MGLVHQLVEMNHLECLEMRIANICDRMKNIRSQGSIAPPLTWIQKYYVQKPNGKKYYYYRLLEATNRRSCTGSIQGKVKLYLGNKHSSKYHTYKAAIRRRNELKWLEKRYQQLMNLYEKVVAQIVGQGSLSEVRSQESEVRSSNNKLVQQSESGVRSQESGVSGTKLVQQSSTIDTNSQSISTIRTDKNNSQPRKLLTHDSLTPDSDLTSIEAKEFKLGNFTPAVVELRASQEQLWYWLKVIAERLGITITGVKENINSVEDVPWYVRTEVGIVGI